MMEKFEDIYERFENGHSYKNQLNLIKDIERCVLFENGKQWVTDEELDEFPKITLNVIKQIGKARKSNIMQNDYGYLINSTNFKSVRKIQDFLKHLSKVLKLRKADLKALNEDFSKGTAIGYFYWDAEKRGFMRGSGGQLRYETIDIRNIVVADPSTTEIQDQEWIIVAKKEKVGAIKQKYGKDKNVIPDGQLYTQGTQIEPIARNIDEERATVYTMFYRNADGEVHSVICTQTTLLKKPTPMNPFYNGTAEESENTLGLHDDLSVKDKRSEHSWNLYPFVRLCLNERDNCFYGLPIVLEYIEAQKSINNHFSVYDKALQDNVLGGFVYRNGVLDGAEVTTDNAQMIGLDLMPNESIQNAFGRFPVANVPTDSVQYSQGLLQTTRQVAGATNIQLGMSDYSGQSGKQTQLLLQRAQENSSDFAVLFTEFKEDQAYIMFLFSKFYYDNEDFTVIEHGYAKDSVRNYAAEDKFNGTEYLDDNVMIDIRVGSAPTFSEYTNLEILGLSVQTGQVPLEAYASLLPDGYISNREEFIETVQNNSKIKIDGLEQKIEQLQIVIQKMLNEHSRVQKDRDNIDTVVKENERLKSLLAETTANAISKVKEATEQTKQISQDMQKLVQAAVRQKQ